jgi:hypothetical protein
VYRALGVAATLSAFAFTGSSAAAASGLVGQWHLDEGAGTVAHDNSGNNNNGTLIPATAPPQWVPGRFGTGLSFSGAQGVQVRDNPVLDPQSQVSVSAWVKSAGSPGAYRYIIGKGATGCDSSSYALYTGPTGGLSFYISNGQSNGIADYNLSPDAGGGVWDGSWHLVVGSFDGSTLRLYVDGVEIGSGIPFSGPIDYHRTSSTDLFIGNYPAPPMPCKAGGFNGLIDEANVWNFAVSPDQVSALYASPPSTGSTPSSSAPPTPTQPPTTTGAGGTGGTGIGQGKNHNSPPALSRLRVSPSQGRRTKAKAAAGMTISYRDTQAAVSTFSVLFPQPGIVQRGRCVAPPKGKLAKHAKRCTRYRVLGKFGHADRAGTNSFAFTAVRVLQLAPHGYLLAATPNARGLAGKTVTAAFTIKR